MGCRRSPRAAPASRGIRPASWALRSAPTADPWRRVARTDRRGCGTPPAACLFTPSRDTARLVSSVAFSPDGQTLATSSADKTIKLWDPATGRPRATLTGHTAWVTRVAFSPDGRRLVSASDDMTVRLWDVTTAREVGILRGQTGSYIRSLAFSPTADGSLPRRWTARSRSGTRRAARKSTGCFLPDITTGSAPSPSPRTGGWPRVARTGRSASGMRHDRPAHPHPHRPRDRKSARWPSASTTRSWPRRILMARSNSGAPSTGELIRTLTGHAQEPRVAFSPDGRRLAAVGQDGRVIVWDVASGEQFRLLGGLSGWREVRRLQSRRLAVGRRRQRRDREALGHGNLAGSAHISRPCGRRLLAGLQSGRPGRRFSAFPRRSRGAALESERRHGPARAERSLGDRSQCGLQPRRAATGHGGRGSEGQDLGHGKWPRRPDARRPHGHDLQRGLQPGRPPPGFRWGRHGRRARDDPALGGARGADAGRAGPACSSVAGGATGLASWRSRGMSRLPGSGSLPAGTWSAWAMPRSTMPCSASAWETCTPSLESGTRPPSITARPPVADRFACAVWRRYALACLKAGDRAVPPGLFDAGGIALRGVREARERSLCRVDVRTGTGRGHGLCAAARLGSVPAGQTPSRRSCAGGTWC